MSASTGPGPNFWNEKYNNKEEFAYGTEPNDFLKLIIPTLNIPKGSKCLMLADGEGRNGVYMAQLGYDVTSVDYSSVGIEKTKQLASSKSVTVEAIVADLATFDLGKNQWDCVVGIFCHFPPPIRSKLLGAIPAAMKKGGYCVLECYRPEQLEYKTGGPHVASLMYSREILLEAFQSKLEIQKNEELVRDVIEGTLHTGKAAVVQFVGRKP
mmetsp:Transcript_18184/g.25025  ORF Transcript_18184/g.25025 Transcript_18184/m.25025 type:complete len:211 (-) Transcript_18184:381-1013(-)|eukprot:CAMPEP_0185730502 /NCGR_PEP_ID=MMETSP1171-20130828/10071_1 /TAXON_ID=374046 /ORGANISM="Helicotheca tamensis, Strain CCMP826" /LENGTH=210 /DNA_ID=CAMNT_0028399559 /DNA_START=43 /DNA_END=675 /DNA_ORIENTATION=+